MGLAAPAHQVTQRFLAVASGVSNAPGDWKVYSSSSGGVPSSASPGPGLTDASTFFNPPNFFKELFHSHTRSLSGSAKAKTASPSNVQRKGVYPACSALDVETRRKPGSGARRIES